MVEQIVTNILSYSICGVSITVVLGLLIDYIKEKRKFRKEKNITKDAIVEGFKEVVIPKDLRINLSKKIDPAIKEAIGEYMKPMIKYCKRIEAENLMMLKIMSKFTHVEKLTEEEQLFLSKLLNSEVESEIDIE